MSGDCCSPRATRITSVILAIFGLVFISLAVWLPNLINQTISDGIDTMVILTPDQQESQTDSWLDWADTSSPNSNPEFYNVYVYNCTNPDEVLQGARPNFFEMGPYAFNLNKVRFNITWGEDLAHRTTITYKTWEYYVFSPEMSAPGLSQDDVITTLNIPFQVLKQFFSDEWNKMGVNDYDAFFSRVSVKDIMAGYEDPVWDAIAKTNPAVPPVFPGLIQNLTGFDDPALAAVGYDTIYSGAAPYQSFQRSYYQWHGQQYLVSPLLGTPLWLTSEANRLHGTEGDTYPRPITKGQVVEAFVDEIFRVTRLENMGGETYTFKDIDLLRFRIQPSYVFNETLFPPNAAYLQNGPQGFFELAATEPTFPEIYASKPHFLDVDPMVANLITGISPPNPDLHEPVIDVEPLSGLAMHAWKRLQINFKVHPFTDTGNSSRTFFPNVATTYFPVVWVEEGGEIKDSLAHEFVKQVYGWRTGASVILYLGYIGGLVQIVTALFLLGYLSLSAGNTAHSELTHPLNESGYDLEK